MGGHGGRERWIILQKQDTSPFPLGDVRLNLKAGSGVAGLVASRRQLVDCSPWIIHNHKITSLRSASTLLLKV